MFFSICLAIILLSCSCVRINAQCTNKGCGNKDTVSAQDVADQILQILNLLSTHDQNLHLQFQNLLNQTKIQGNENKDVVLAQPIANQTSQLQNRLENQSQNLQLQFQNLLNQTETQVRRCENEKKVTTQGLSDQLLQIRNRLDNNDQTVQLQYQKLLNRTENLDVAMTQTIANKTSQLQNRLGNQSQSLQLQFQNLVNKMERQVVATQGIADQILQLHNRMDNQDQTVQLVCRKLLTQFERQDICGSVPLLRDCSDIRASGQRTNGVYPVYVEHKQKLRSTNAFCDMTSTNRTSWLIFQRRKDGSVDFYRTWSEYATGFGDPNGEFWFGNEMLHLLTSKRNYKLRVELEDFEGNRRYAEYARFSIGSYDDNYRLTVSGYSGNAGNSLLGHNGMQFSTKDANNDFDNSTGSCAIQYHGAWWYRACGWSNLNGKYHHGNYSGRARFAEGVFWNGWLNSFYSLKTTEMKIAPVIGFT